MSERTIESWVAGKLFATRKIGGRRLIEKDSLDAWIDSAERVAAIHESDMPPEEAAPIWLLDLARKVARLIKEDKI